MQLAIGLLTSGFGALTGGGAAAAGTAVAGATAATGAATGGFSLSSLLQGTATLLGAVSAIGAGEAEADLLEAKAIDAEAQVPLETLQGIQRRASIKRELMDSIGSQDTAFAASGVDLSFGTPGVARREAFREADLGLTSDAGTQETRQNRLHERSRSFRRSARRARKRGFVNAIGAGLSFGADVLKRG